MIEVYKLTNNFPREELYGLTSQMRRAAVSVAANIAEGFKKRGKKDKARFLNISEGSLEELRYYLLLSGDLEYADTKMFKPLTGEVGKLLSSYMKAILK